MSTSSRLSLAFIATLVACAGSLGLEPPTLDSDLDGVPDRDDNCPLDPNPDQANLDGVGPGDACDVCPASRATGEDVDGDGRDDGCDGCVGPGVLGEDTDGDGVDDGCQPCVGGTTSWYDTDKDHDHIPDACDDCVGYIDFDIDRDDVDDACDVCLGGPNVDEDGDGVMDSCDNCPVMANAEQVNTTDIDALGDACDPNRMTNDARRQYDPFRTLPIGWLETTGTGAWSAEDEALRGKPTEPGKVTMFLSPNAQLLTNQVFEVSTRLATFHPSESPGLALADANGTRVTCRADGHCVRLDVGMLATSVDECSPNIDIDPRSATLVLRESPVGGPSNNVLITCALRDPANRDMILGAQTAAIGGEHAWRYGFITDFDAEFSWIEVIEQTAVITNALEAP